MIEQLTLTTELQGAIQKIEVTYSYYGTQDIDIHNVLTEAGYHLETGDLTDREAGTLRSCIVNHKTNKVAI